MCRGEVAVVGPSAMLSLFGYLNKTDFTFCVCSSSGSLLPNTHVCTAWLLVLAPKIRS